MAYVNPTTGTIHLSSPEDVKTVLRILEHVGILDSRKELPIRIEAESKSGLSA